MSKKKICFIAQFPPPIHGLSKAVDTLYNSDLKNEFEFEKVDITNNKCFLKNLALIRKSNADLFYFTISQTKGGNLRDLVILKLLAAYKKKCLIHLHGGYYRQLVDNDMSSYQRKENYKAIKKLDGVIVLSESLKSIFQGMIADEKIHVVMNCVDDEFLLSDAEVDEKLKVLKTKKVLHIMYLSNFIRTKGYPEVLKMAQMEKERVEAGGEKRFKFDFAGKFFENTEKEFFEGYIREHSLEEFVKYHGIIEGQQKRDLLKRCDIFALPTRYPNEGQPISILEAMGNAMMVITTDHAGIPDIVTDGVNGIVADKGIQTENVYGDLLGFSNMQFIEISVRNREHCKTEFTQRKYIEKMEYCFNMDIS